MTPGARLQTAIEILEEIGSDARPADRVLHQATRARRYMGSKDRRAVAERVYGALRHRARLGWWLERLGMTEVSARSQLLAQLAIIDGQNEAEIAALFNGEGYGPPALTESETACLVELGGAGLYHDDQALAVQVECPAWLFPQFERAFGEAVEEQLTALMVPAYVDLRVNSLKGDRATAIAALARESLAVQATSYSPWGLRLERSPRLRSSRAFIEGLVESQDESSQIAALLCDARAGMSVADACAGAGGKTLALAAAMAGKGRLVAADIDEARLSRAAPRLRRAGVTFVECIAGEIPAAEGAGTFDRVLVDAPCSGTGAWRRNPEARWSLTPERLAAFQSAQQEVLQKAAVLVKPGGRLIYATCSLLPSENQEQVAKFLSAQSAFHLLPVAGVWQACMPGDCPTQDDTLLLTPADHGTDGFFVAVLERREA